MNIINCLFVCHFHIIKPCAAKDREQLDRQTQADICKARICVTQSWNSLHNRVELSCDLFMFLRVYTWEIDRDNVVSMIGSVHGRLSTGRFQVGCPEVRGMKPAHINRKYRWCPKQCFTQTHQLERRWALEGSKGLYALWANRVSILHRQSKKRKIF